MLTCKDGSVDFEFNNYEKNMNFSPEATKKFSSKIKGKGHAKNAPFVFEAYFNLYNRKHIWMKNCCFLSMKINKRQERTPLNSYGII